jgi:hypothetical protein
MKIIKDTLEPIIEEWDDPGDYPSSAGSGPLPSYKYIAGCDGEVVVELDAADMLLAWQQEIWEGWEIDTNPSVTVKKWSEPKMEIVDGKLRLTLQVEECDADCVEDNGGYDD